MFFIVSLIHHCLSSKFWDLPLPQPILKFFERKKMRSRSKISLSQIWFLIEFIVLLVRKLLVATLPKGFHVVEIKICFEKIYEGWKPLLVRSVDDQLGTPRRRCDDHNSKFPLSMKPRFNRPVGERNHFWRLMLTGFWQGTLPAPEATWNLHTTQPRYFAPTCSEVVYLTGLLKTMD
jgi:hypothetical protein